MTDSQSIILILIGFYLVECLKWAPLSAVSHVSPLIWRSRWNALMPTVNFFGMRKSMFFAPILPALQVQLITDKVGDGGHQHSKVKTARGIRRRLFRLRVRTSMLRAISAYVFVIYFLCLPTLYFNFGEGSYVYTTVGVGYLLQAICALCYFPVHKCFFPKERGVRVLNTFYNLVLPWHAMRASDELFIKSSLEWSELAILGATTPAGQQNEQLALYWRQAKLLENPAYTSDTLRPILSEIGMSTECAMTVSLPDQDGQSHCPCCGVVYERGIEQCADCSISLIKKEVAICFKA